MSRRLSCLLLTVGVVLSLATAAGTQATPVKAPETISMSFRAGVGSISYSEEFSIMDLSADWDGTVGFLGGEFTLDTGFDVILKGEGQIWASGSDTEDWTWNGAHAQENDLEASGADLLGEIGYRVLKTDQSSIVPYAGVGMRSMHFVRENAEVFTADLSGYDKAEEDVDIAYANLAVEAEHAFSPEWLLFGRAGVGFVFFSEAENDLLDVAIEGSGGTIVDLRGGVGWRPAASHLVSLTIRYEMQDLEGDTDQVYGFAPDLSWIPYDVEWPDNETEKLWVEAAWKIAL